MVTTEDVIKAATNTKQNFSGEDTEIEVPIVVRDKMRIWNKIHRIQNGSAVDVAVILPYNTFIEPYYSTTDVDMTVDNCGVYDSSNEYFRLYSDLLGNFKYITSKNIYFRQDMILSRITMTVDVVDTNGDSALDQIQMFIYNGNEWIATRNGHELLLQDHNSADLDADLDADVGGSFANVNASGTILFQNKIKYQIVRTGSSEVRVRSVVITVK